MSPIRKRYMLRLVLRCIVLVLCTVLWIADPAEFEILKGMNFFRCLSPLHLLWAVWVMDMVQQIIPLKNQVPLGSQKLFANRFRPIRKKINYEALRSYIVTTTKAAYKVFLLWWLLIAVIGLLHFGGVVNKTGLFLISVIFYVCDLICVLIWCPFRLIMRNRCCTTCRIFNWDHLMMFTPLLFIGSFYTWSLLAVAVAVWALWEACVLLFPERFWEGTNAALQCSQCVDKLCTQYCRKLR